MCANKLFLEKLGLLNIDGFKFKETLNGGSALSSLYVKGDELVVFKFLVAPRNRIELERFKLEFSVLDKNLMNWRRSKDSGEYFDLFIGPKESYPLPRISYPLTQVDGGLVTYFGYEYEHGVLLADLDTASYTESDKVKLLHRVASGLHYFNQSGYVHRDLHPENILLLDNPDMPRDERFENNPKIRILDMGNCQRTNTELDYIWRIKRDLDEDSVYKDNNRRVLSSFISMPPDFLEKGDKTENYDSWSFGIFTYFVLFGELPFAGDDIEDVTNLRNTRQFSDNYYINISSISIGLKEILNHLLSPNGSERPTIDSIVRLLSWLIYRASEFKDEDFISQVIHERGYDPNYDPMDDY